VTAVVRQRLHQRGFRQRVLRGYQQCCAPTAGTSTILADGRTTPPRVSRSTRIQIHTLTRRKPKA